MAGTPELAASILCRLDLCFAEGLDSGIAARTTVSHVEVPLTSADSDPLIKEAIGASFVEDSGGSSSLSEST